MHGSSIDYAEGRVFSFDDESAILLDFLLMLDYSGTRQRIRYQMNEFKEVFHFLDFQIQEYPWLTIFLKKIDLAEIYEKLFHLFKQCWHFSGRCNI